MHAEILPISLDHKAKVLGLTRDRIIPYLIKRALPSEEVLKLFHKAGTRFATNGSCEQDFLNKAYQVFFGGAASIPTSTTQLEEFRKESGNGDFYDLGEGFYRGNYRILGCFEPHPVIAQYAPEADEYFTGALPISTRDYLHQEAPLYYPPIFNIHKIMAALGDDFDQRIKVADNESDLASNVADFYFWGLVMTHPFLGGNHRAFDRFIEYAFAQANIAITLPQSKTLNIPNNDPFNVALYQERRRLLQNAGLDKPRFSKAGSINLPSWIKYQHNLNDMIQEGITNRSANTYSAARELVSWI